MNISEIAKLAGVSSAAVSRYFNQGYLSEDKKEAIRRVVEETGYTPSVQAQSLRTKKTKTVGVIVPKISSASIGKVVEGILTILNKEKYQMLLAVTQNNPQKELEYLASFNERQVDGVILVATILTDKHKTALKKMNVPVVVIGQQQSGICCVYHDDYNAAYEMTSKILNSGRTKLGYLSAIWKDKAAGLERYRGFCDAVSENGFEHSRDSYEICEFTLDSGYEKAKDLLEKHPDLDGIICATDTIAFGAMRFLKEKGIEVHKQILVAGYGGSIYTKLASPEIPTVYFHYEKSGKVGVEMLLSLINQEEDALKEVKLGYKIVDNGAIG